MFSVPPNVLDAESTQSTVAIRENQNISLTCKAEGFPTPKITWRREDGQSISVDRRKKGKLYVQQEKACKIFHRHEYIYNTAI